MAQPNSGVGQVSIARSVSASPRAITVTEISDRMSTHPDGGGILRHPPFSVAILNSQSEVWGAFVALCFWMGLFAFFHPVGSGFAVLGA